MDNIRTNTNASASLLGWDFQINAAIVLFMLNLKAAKSVRVEGKVEDIEITLNDNTKIYSQAKHVADPENNNTVRTHLINALRTLNTASRQSDIRSLIYVTNSPNPFSDKRTMAYFTRRTELSYIELPILCKNKIHELIEKYQYIELDVNKLMVNVIPFYGINEENKYKEIRSVVEDTLADLKIDTLGVAKNILYRWQRYFFQNATEVSITVELSKKELLWALIVTIMESPDSIKYKIDYSDDDLEFIKDRYLKVINNETLNFELITRVLYDYKKSKTIATKFIEDNWINYMDVVEMLNDDNETLSVVVKMILYKILVKRDSINRIKMEVGL